ncbi:MAG: indole-3-glycerol phosphate synthase TrpC [Firmicutes bacterium]|nr:indole-3-glycerol phosphate synthase TrpC [Bacillota bacterium]
MGFLELVAQEKRESLRQLKRQVPLEHIMQRVKAARPYKPGLAENLSIKGMSVIAEVKRASPSRGQIAPGIDAAKTAVRYEKAGARAVSVLTEENHFQGSLQDLREACIATRLPVLCKDFVIDPYQVWMAAECGASAVLLIARMLGNQLEGLLAECREAGIEALVEVHSFPEVELALAAGSGIIGVNCRDLDTLAIDAGLHGSLRRGIPPGVITVAESGIRDRAQVQGLERLGYDAILVGESLVQAEDPADKIKQLLG